MENTAYYLESQRIVFLTKEDARDYFFMEEIYHYEANYLCLNEFLNSKGYNCEDVFVLNEAEKEDILTEYHEALFESWANHELIECYMYE